MNKLIMCVMQIMLNNLRKRQDTPYVYIKGTGKDDGKYLMYTDDKGIASKMHRIY